MNVLVAAAFLLLSAGPSFQSYDGKADGFRIDFPGEPKVESKDKTTRSYTLDTDNGVYLVIVSIDSGLSPDNAGDEFKDFRTSEKEDAKIVSEKALTLGSLPGLELKTKGKDMDAITRLYVGRGRSWLVSLDVDHGHSFSELGADTFFASFSVTTEKAEAPKPVAAAAPKGAAISAPTGDLSPSGLEVIGWTPDGSQVVVIEHISDERGNPSATVSFFDTAKNAVMAKPQYVQLDNEKGESEAVAEAFKLIEPERVRLKLPALVKGRTFTLAEGGAISHADGSPIGNLEIKSKVAAKKDQSRPCAAPWKANVYSVRLFILDDDKPITLLDEKKVPSLRACSESCVGNAAFGQGKAGLFVLRCRKQEFEGFGFQTLMMTVGKLEYPLEADLPPQ
jgi:hypothetical protein